ncbi:MAG TPA: DUF2232 domain-containing protein [Gemmatimonadaceae bacterium]|nr:DUF2232 domain-containing protein [Gemmatimonadaceae bacterium]
MTEPAATEQKKGSWRQLALALAAFLLLPLIPIVRSIVPIEQTLMLVVPVVAICALVGWKLGGRAALAAIWLVLAAWMLIQSAGPAGTPYDKMARGWVLLLAASFGAVTLWSVATPFFVRAMAAIGLAAAVGFSIAVASPGGIDRVKHAAGDELTRRSGESIEALHQLSASPTWIGWSSKSPSLDEVAERSEAQLRAVPEYAANLLPALLALESLAALAIAWGLYHRLSPVAVGPPLGPLKEFRFNDQLVWGLAVGATLFLLPSFVEAKVAGLNLLLFFGALYLTRGLGVMAWMSRGRILLVVVVLMAVLAPPILGALAIGLGLGDTWLDWRRKVRTT